jgi:hypothetical protein
MSKINLANHAVLVRILMSSYAGTKLDVEVSDELAAQKKCKVNKSGDAARVNKVIYHREFLLPISRRSMDFYKWLKANSHEWSRGVYLIKASFLEEVTERYEKAKREFDSELNNLCSDDVREKAHADYKSRTGEMFDADLWPSVDELRERFTFEISVEPLPDPKTSDSLIMTIGRAAADRIAADTEKRKAEKTTSINHEAIKRLCDVTRKMHAKLADADSVFRDTLVTNLAEMVAVVGKLNVTDDPELEKLRREVETDLCSVDPQILRDDPEKRVSQADKAKAVIKKMDGMMSYASHGQMFTASK